MAGALRMDMMYEGSSARQMTPGEYRGPVCDRAGRREKGRAENCRECRTSRRIVEQSGSGAYRGRLSEWEEPRRGGRGSSQAAVRRRTVNTASRKKRKMQRSIIRWLLFYFCLSGVAATVWMICSLLFGGGKKAGASETQGQADGVYAMSGAVSEEGGPAEWKEAGADAPLEITPEIRQECQELYARNESLLMLVNKEHEFSAACQPMLRNICKGRLQAADVLYGDLCDMLQAGGDAGYEYWIASAHRDRAYQQGLVDEDVEKYMSKGYSYETALRKTYEYTMPAGQSEHETGLALDILCSNNTIMDESQKEEPGNRWLVEHCHEYGFILRYPENKEEITGIRYEPWHFRYVGREAAAYLAEKGWTLEEFYGALETDSGQK